MVVGVGGFSHIVKNVERSVEFYRDVIGLGMQRCDGLRRERRVCDDGVHGVQRY